MGGLLVVVEEDVSVMYDRGLLEGVLKVTLRV